MPRQNQKRAGAAPAPATPAAAKPAAKKPTKASEKPQRSWDKGVSDFTRSAANFFTEQVNDAESRNGGLTVGSEAEQAVIGVPLRAFSLQYLYSSDVYPLGRMELKAGESDSCKTAHLFEQMRWFLREAGAGAVYTLNEARDPVDLRTSIVGKQLLNDGRFRLEGPCESLEDWQRRTTNLLHKFEGAFKQKGGSAFPLIDGLDSITGTTSERTIAAIDEVGCATTGYGGMHDANLLNQYSKYLFQRLHKWPIAFVATSHVKWGSDKYGNKVMKIPGGDSLRFVSTYILFMKKIKDIDRLDVGGGRRLSIKTIKSMGEHREILVDFVWHFEPTGQVSTWNWHGATAELLFGFTGDRKKALDEIVTFPLVNKTAQTCACPEVGIKKPAPWDEVGKAIMDTPAVLRALQDHFGVKRRSVFQEGVPYADQISAAIAAGDTFRPDMSDANGVDATAEDDEGEAVLKVE